MWETRWGTRWDTSWETKSGTKRERSRRQSGQHCGRQKLETNDKQIDKKDNVRQVEDKWEIVGRKVKEEWEAPETIGRQQK